MSDRSGRLAGRIALGSGAAAYLVAVAVAASHLTFYWDDHFFILTLMDRGLGGALLTGINGHWWPLATLILYVQTLVFGFWYPGYIVTNAVIVLATAWIAWRILHPVVARARWLVTAGLVVFVTSFGVVVNVLVITVSWPLSVALATLAALLLSRDRPWWTWTPVLALSFLAGSGLFLANMIAAAALFLAARSGASAPEWRYRAKDLVTASLALLLGAAGTLVGFLITRTDPINYYGGGTDGVAQVEPATAFNLLQSAESVLSNTVAWASSPLLPGFLILPKAMPWLMILVATYLVGVVAGAVLVGAVVWHGVRSGGPGWFMPLRPRLLAALILLVPVASTAGILSLLRSGSIYAPRFWILWLIPAVALWAIVLDSRMIGRLSAVAFAGLRSLLVLAAALGVLALPWTLVNATDVDKERWAATDAQWQRAARCVDGLTAEPLAEIAPAVSPQDYCRLVLHLRAGSATGRMLDYPSGTTSGS